MGQHYVARFYLRPWSEKGKLYCLSLKGRRIRHRGLRAVANEKLFYRLHALTPEEREFIERVLIEPSPEPLKEIQRNFLTLLSLPAQLRKHTGTSNLGSEFTALLDDMIVNAAEKYHSGIEACLKPFVVSMLAGDVEFYSDKKQAAEFLYAISVQFTRTKRARDAAVSQIGTKYKGCDPERLWSVSSHIVAASVGQSLYADRKQFRLMVVDNSTDTPFITADQPIINLHAQATGKIPDKLEFFYPLSPRKAMLLVETSNQRHIEPSLSPFAVNNYNVLILRNAYEQVFSNSAEYLETIKKLSAMDS
jgi:hypothetical protein